MSTYESDLLDSIEAPDLTALTSALVKHERETIAKTLDGFIAWLASQDPDEDTNPQEAHQDICAAARKFRQRVLDQHLARTSGGRYRPSHWSKR